MFRKDLIAAILGLVALVGISPLFANDSKSLNAPLPYIDPVPNILPVEPGIDLPIRSILPVEPIMDPVPGVEPKGPISDQPSRSILPVEPIIEPDRSDVNPVLVPPPPGSSVFNRPQDQIGRRGRDVFGPRGRNAIGDGRSVNRPWPNVTPREIGVDEPRGYFPVEPIIIDPPRNIIPVEPGIDPRREPMPMVIDSDEPAMPRQRPIRVLPEPRRRSAGAIPSPVNSKDGVVSQINRRLVTPIIVPNPLVNQSARISFQPVQRLSGNIQLSVYDLSGKAVISSNLQARRDGIYQVDLGRLSNGSYLLRLSAPGVDATQKMVVQR